ncbi:hypothetical protein M0Q50_01420 [bacterium]|jgi:hypothetical protein|nr:hypothetical protein [bacterium]
MHKNGIKKDLIRSRAVELNKEGLSFDISKVNNPTLKILGENLAKGFKGYNWVFANTNQNQLANIFSKFTNSKLYYPNDMEIPASAANQKIRLIFLKSLVKDSDIMKIIYFFEANTEPSIEKVAIASIINGATRFYHPDISLTSLFKEKEFVF